MQVHTYEVPESVIAAVQAAMVGTFTASDLTHVAIKAGAPESIPSNSGYGREYCANRIADRLIQKARKAGLIDFKGGKWTRVKN